MKVGEPAAGCGLRSLMMTMKLQSVTITAKPVMKRAGTGSVTMARCIRVQSRKRSTGNTITLMTTAKCFMNGLMVLNLPKHRMRS